MRNKILPWIFAAGLVLPYNANAQEPYNAKSREISPPIIYPAYAKLEPGKKNVGKSLDKIIETASLEIIETADYSDKDTLTYNLFASVSDYKLPVGFMKLGAKKGDFLDIHIRLPLLYKKHISLLNIDGKTHIQIEDEEGFTYGFNGREWIFVNYTGRDTNKVNLLGSRFSGENPMDIIRKKLSGQDINMIDTFINGSWYRGEIYEGKNSPYTRLELDMSKLRVYEKGGWKFFADNSSVVLGDVAAIFNDNLPLAVIGNIQASPKILPSFWIKISAIREDISY